MSAEAGRVKGPHKGWFNSFDKKEKKKDTLVQSSAVQRRRMNTALEDFFFSSLISPFALLPSKNFHKKDCV